ncbi:cupin domain-containing protein [Ammoniphilus sp. YIM 78166]|uniref:cupin domain-containing protein n=1 Tax=Ammoniphilus sp. YIM 78166 TaxID=1644106 RepID=UPI00106F6745|nr:cupin domain-containing protein [Ammoniphilus sp. YIM 78166]
MFVDGNLVQPVEAESGVKRKLMSRGGTLMMTEVTFEKGAVGALHAHPHEQISYIVQGSFEFHLEGQVQIVKKGDSIYVPSNQTHGVTALEEQSIILDVFTPQREEFTY